MQEIAPGALGAAVSGMAAAGPRVFFGANDGSAGQALWALPLTSQPLRRGVVGPFRRIAAEEFDRGGEGLAYHDRDAGDRGGAGRAGAGVDIQQAGGASYLAYAESGEWLSYSLRVATPATYSARVRVAALGAGGTFHLEIDGTAASGPIQVPDTGGWTSWRTLALPNLELPAGAHTLRLVLDTNGSADAVGNLDWIELADSARLTVSLPLVSR